MKSQLYRFAALVLSLSLHLSLISLFNNTYANSRVLQNEMAGSHSLTVQLVQQMQQSAPSLINTLQYKRPYQIASEKLIYNDGPSPLKEKHWGDLLMGAQPYYFYSTELTDKPVVLQDTSADLLLQLPDLPVQSIILRLLINEQGDIDKVVVEDSDLPEAIREMIIAAFYKTKFYPGKINNDPVKSQMVIQVSVGDLEAQP